MLTVAGGWKSIMERYSRWINAWQRHIRRGHQYHWHFTICGTAGVQPGFVLVALPSGALVIWLRTCSALSTASPAAVLTTSAGWLLPKACLPLENRMYEKQAFVFDPGDIWA